MSGEKIRVFTSLARNYRAKARVLFDSIAEHHPEWERNLLLAERGAGAEDKRAVNADRVWSLPDLDIPEWEPWSFGHTLVELATAVKPFLLKRLLAEPDTRAVLYFDPDVRIYSRLDDLTGATRDSSVLLTPHQLAPETDPDRVVGNELSSLRHGVYNLGFIAVSADAVGSSFSQWWSERLYRYCRDDPAAGLFTDQKWIDLAPALFPRVGIVRAARFNVASWNLSRRRLTRSGAVFLVDGEPLGFYHFTGASSSAHDLMLLRYVDPQDAAVARDLLVRYRALEAEASRLIDCQEEPWTFASYADGSAVSDTHRRLYRDHVTLQRAHPNPYDDPKWRQIAERLRVGRSGDSALLPTPSPGYGPRTGINTGRLVGMLHRVLRGEVRVVLLVRRLVRIIEQEGVRGVMRRLR